MLKRTSVLALIVIMLLTMLPGCTSEKSSQGKNKGYELLYSNNIDVKGVYEEDDEYQTGSYIVIDGLKDKSVQDKINKLIYDSYSKLRKSTEIPAYRGILLDVKDGFEVVSSYTDVYVEGSFNNILSLRIDKNSTYGNPAALDAEGYSEDNVYCSSTETLNIDLNTGDEITLQDVFARGEDGQAYINDKISEMSFKSGDNEYDYIGNSLCFTGKFEGINENQKFLIRPQGLILIFDYNNPEIYIEDYYARTVSIDISDVSDLGSKYTDGTAAIYEDETVSYMLPEIQYDDNNAVEKTQSLEIGEAEYRMTLSCSIRYNSEMPDSVKNYVEKMLEPSEEILQNITGKYNELRASGRSVTGDGSYEVSASAGYGNYTIVNINYYYGFYDAVSGNYCDDSTCYYSKTFCMSADSEEPLELKDLFEDGYDYEKALEDIIFANYQESMKRSSEEEAAITDTESAEGEISSEEAEPVEEILEAADGDTIVSEDNPVGNYVSDDEIRIIIGEIMSMMSGYSLTGEYLCMIEDSDISYYLYDKIPDEDQVNVLRAAIAMIYYREIGCSNMKIFS